MNTCSQPGCDRRRVGHGLCATHWIRQRRGIPLDRPIREVFHTDDVGERLRHYCPQGDSQDCWEWPLSRDKGGYGLIAVGQKRKRGAHIVAWEVSNGRPVPEGVLVRHKCDNPPCTNPEHLEIGSHGDNANDRVTRNRHVVGTGYRARTAEEVDEIRRLAELGVPHADLARQFGCTHGTINRIVAEEVFPTGKRRGHAVKLNEPAIRRIRELSGLGYTQQHIADEFGLHQSTISAILARKLWGHVT